MSVTIVLVEATPINIGLIARAMKNFGFSKLVITGDVNITTIMTKSKVTARHAFDVIEKCKFFPDLPTAISDAKYTIGTTARRGGDRNLGRLTVYPEQLRTLPLLNECHIVFGRENSGLTNQEASMCDLLVTIPSSEEYSVLNLSHAVAVILYEISKIVFPKQEWKHRPATAVERNKLTQVFNQLVETSAFKTEKRNVANLSFENIVTRGYVTGREAYTLIGVLKWVNRCLEITQTDSNT
ncbi:MAG: RNA methyltransferase [Promethearchaeota archaeon]